MKARTRNWSLGMVAVASLVVPTTGNAQSVEDLAIRFAGMTAVSGYERPMADSLLVLLPTAMQDRAGNVVLTLGSGEPTRVAACPMDEWGYVVGRLRDDGWITLRRVGAGQPPLWDQMHEGHRMTIWTRSGPVPAVMAVPSTHLARGRASLPTTPFSSDDAYLDTGATSAADVADLGIQVVDPVALEKATHRYGQQRLAGVDAARRSACAALAAVAISNPPVRGTVHIAFTTESRLRHRGLFTLINQRGPVTGTLLLDYPIRRTPETLGTVRTLELNSRYGGTQVETVDLTDLPGLMAQIRQWLNGGESQ